MRYIFAKPKNKGTPLIYVVAFSLGIAVSGFFAGLKVDEISLFQKNSNPELPADLSYESVERVYDALRQNYDGELTEQQILDGIKSGLAQSTNDPYTVYLNQEQAKQFNDDLNGTFSGIGAEIGKRNDAIIIISPLEGFPAKEAGLRANDVVLKIDDEETFGLDVHEAVLKIRGAVGSTVTLTILRADKQLEIPIERQKIVVPSVTSEVIDGIGYLQISRFAEDTVRLAREATEAYVDQGIDKVILDMRNNSGGYLEAAVDIAGLWLNNEVVVEQREAGGKVVTERLRSGSSALLKNTETVILINEGSASASEIVAGALKDYGVGELVGQTTFGKGSVQSLENFADGSVLKVTIAKWFTPFGDSIDEQGIQPDFEVELSERDYNQGRDPQLDKAKELLL